jgi:enamine deaminase RidA (YjgF/YER057c/UK114 family)
VEHPAISKFSSYAAFFSLLSRLAVLFNLRKSGNVEEKPVRRLPTTFFLTKDQEPRMNGDDVSTIRRMNPAELDVPPGYSHVVEVSGGRLVFISGQAAANADGDVVGKNDFSAQAAQVFRNLEIGLKAAGAMPETWSR